MCWHSPQSKTAVLLTEFAAHYLAKLVELNGEENPYRSGGSVVNLYCHGCLERGEGEREKCARYMCS